MTTLTTGNETPMVCHTPNAPMLMAYENVDVDDDAANTCGEFVQSALEEAHAIEIESPVHCLVWIDGKWTLRGFTEMGTPYPFVEHPKAATVAQMLATEYEDEDSLEAVIESHDAESLPADLTKTKTDD